MKGAVLVVMMTHMMTHAYDDDGTRTAQGMELHPSLGVYFLLLQPVT